MKFHHSLENYLLIGLFAAVSLLAAYGIISAAHSGESQPKPIHVSSTIQCSFSDKSFCNTEQFFKTLVDRADFSTVLENQTPIRKTCSGKTPTQAYCNGAKDGLIIQLFRVDQDGRSQLLTRNQYITFFNSYFQHQGPFAYASTIASGSDILMRYENHAGTELYILRFTKMTSTWKLAYPSISVVHSKS